MIRFPSMFGARRLWDRLKGMSSARKGRLVVGLGLPLIAWGAAALALDAHGRRELNEDDTWDAIIVAGCRVYPGGVASPSLEKRTRRAVELWREKRAPLIIFTGGVGRNPPSEARVARDLALELGVPEDSTRIESRSTSTLENARFASEIVDVDRILVVTDSYHVFRTKRVFARFFDDVDGAGSVATPWPRFSGALREVFALSYYWARGRL